MPSTKGAQTSPFLLPFCHKGIFKNDFLKKNHPQKREKTAFFGFS
jgi:hypothetical protein